MWPQEVAPICIALVAGPGQRLVGDCRELSAVEVSAALVMVGAATVARHREVGDGDRRVTFCAGRFLGRGNGIMNGRVC